MAEEKKKIDLLDEEIKKTQNEYMGRSFSYDSKSDAGYREYTRLMRENGKRAMEDTVGKASALTGGYANSYAVTAGQQVYDDYAKKAADAQATYRQLAREEYDAQNQDILNRLAMLNEKKSGLWDDAALRAQTGDFSKYVDMGAYETVDAAKIALGAAPNEQQIAYAKEIFAKQGVKGLDSYIASLDVGNADSLIEAALDDFANQFQITKDGGKNHGGGLNNNTKLKLGDEEHSVKKWYQILQDEYGFTDDEAYQFLIDVQTKSVSEEE